MTMNTGLTRLTARPLAEIDSIAIAGEAAVEIAEAFTAAGGPPLVLESARFALLSRSTSHPSAGRVRDLPSQSVDLVVLRRAWHRPGEVAEALLIARDRTVPGGEVIGADLDVSKLLAGPSPRYPGRLFYLAAPEAADGLRASTATPGLLSTEAVRAGLKPVELATYDDVRGTYETAAELWQAIRARGWRGAAWTAAERQGAVLDAVAASLGTAVPAGPAVDREPWYAVLGMNG